MATWIVRLAGDEFRVRLEREPSGGAVAQVERVDGTASRHEVCAAGRSALLVDGEPLEYVLQAGTGGEFVLHVGGDAWPGEVLTDLEALGRATETRTGGPVKLRAPMPGKLLAVHAREGDRVAAGAPLVVIEAMKMENEIKAPVGGLLRRLSIAVGEAVDQDQELCVIDPEPR